MMYFFDLMNANLHTRVYMTGSQQEFWRGRICRHPWIQPSCQVHYTALHSPWRYSRRDSTYLPLFFLSKIEGQRKHEGEEEEQRLYGEAAAVGGSHRVQLFFRFLNSEFKWKSQLSPHIPCALLKYPWVRTRLWSSKASRTVTEQSFLHEIRRSGESRSARCPVSYTQSVGKGGLPLSDIPLRCWGSPLSCFVVLAKLGKTSWGQNIRDTLNFMVLYVKTNMG